MNGIDISNHQKGIPLSKIAADFVIIKATQGVSYKSPSFYAQITEALSLGRLVGVYHYASQGGAIPEAEHFLSVVQPYIGQVILCFDWEKDQNVNFTNPEYAVAWLKYVEQRTGIKPFIYMSKSVCRQYANKWDNRYPLWCAQYKNQLPQIGYNLTPWTDTKGFGPWAGCQILQYSSKGRLAGYALHNLDLDMAYITADEWRAYARGTMTNPTLYWRIGFVYTTQVNLYIRETPNGIKKPYSQITKNAQAHAYSVDGNAVLRTGTRVTVKDISEFNGNVWVRIPSGWICAQTPTKIYVL